MRWLVRDEMSCEISAERSIVWDGWVLWDEWCVMNGVRWVVWDAWCTMNGVRWMVWDEWCEMTGMKWLWWEVTGERWMVWDERYEMTGERWVVSDDWWDEWCVIIGVRWVGQPLRWRGFDSVEKSLWGILWIQANDSTFFTLRKDLT